MATEFRIAVMSDLHCHPKDDIPRESFLHSNALTKPPSHHPIASLHDLIERENISADLLLAPGDLTNKSSQEGITAAWQFIQNISHSIGSRNLIATVGNHDVDSHHIHGTDPFLLVKGLEKFPSKSYPHCSDFWGKRYFIFEDGDLRVIVLNSIAQHTNAEDAKRGKIDKIDLDTLEAELKELGPFRFQIACVHHHPIQHEDLDLGSSDLMENGDNLIQILNNYGYKLVIHGHKHHPRLTYAQGGSNSPTVFAAGSLSAFNDWGITTHTRNLFHLVHLNPDSHLGCTLCGQIQSWEFNYGIGWQQTTEQSTGFPSLAGFGCRVPLEQLVDRTHAWYMTQVGPYTQWDDALKVIPELQFLIPIDRRNYESMLAMKYDIQILHSNSGVVCLAQLKG